MTDEKRGGFFDVEIDWRRLLYLPALMLAVIGFGFGALGILILWPLSFLCLWGANKLQRGPLLFDKPTTPESDDGEEEGVSDE